MPTSNCFCSCCVKFIISAITIVLCGWLSVHSIKTPRYYLVSFSFPSTNSSSPITTFQLEIENKNRHIGIYHDDINLTLLAGPNLSSPLSRCVVPAFYQGHRKTAEKPGNFSGISDGNRALLGGESAVFRVSANSAFRFKGLGWKSGHHAVNISGDVEVDADGNKTGKKGIRLSSCAAVVVPAVLLGLFLCALFY